MKVNYLILAIVLFDCGSQSTNNSEIIDDFEPIGDFAPLVVGNVWEYSVKKENYYEGSLTCSTSTDITISILDSTCSIDTCYYTASIHEKGLSTIHSRYNNEISYITIDTTRKFIFYEVDNVFNLFDNIPLFLTHTADIHVKDPVKGRIYMFTPKFESYESYKTLEMPWANNYSLNYFADVGLAFCKYQYENYRIRQLNIYMIKSFNGIPF